MKKRRTSNIISSALLIAGSFFALQVLISNVDAVTNKVDFGHGEGNYIYGIINGQMGEIETDALFVGDVCVYSSTGYFDNKINNVGTYDEERGGYDKDLPPIAYSSLEPTRIECNGVVPGVSFNKTTNTLALNNYKGGENIIYLNSRKTTKEDLNINVLGDNRVGTFGIYNYVPDEQSININIDGNKKGLLRLAGNALFRNLKTMNNDGWILSTDGKVVANLKNIQIDAASTIGGGHVGCIEVDGNACQFGHYFYPSLVTDSLSLDNVIYSGSLSYDYRKLSLKNSVIEPFYDDGYSFHNDGENEIEIENTIFTKPMNYLRGVFDVLNIKNSSIELEDVEDRNLDYFTLISAGDTIATCGSGYDDTITISGDHVSGTCAEAITSNVDYVISDRISIEDAEVSDNLQVKSFVIKREHNDGRYSYVVESVLGTNEIAYNTETEKWDNYPKHIVITANKTSLLGTDFEKRDPSKVDWETGANESDEGDEGDEGETLRAIKESDILEGAKQEMSLDEISDLVIRYDRDIELFSKAMFDGKELSENDYTLKAGSTILTIKADYLKTQKAGEHKVSAYFEGDNGPIETTITLKASEPKTTDGSKGVGTSNTGLYTVEKGDYSETSKTIFTVLAFGLIISGAILKIRNRNKKAIYRSR